MPSLFPSLSSSHCLAHTDRWNGKYFWVFSRLSTFFLMFQLELLTRKQLLNVFFSDSFFFFWYFSFCIIRSAFQTHRRAIDHANARINRQIVAQTHLLIIFENNKHAGWKWTLPTGREDSRFIFRLFNNKDCMRLGFNHIGYLFYLVVSLRNRTSNSGNVE